MNHKHILKSIALLTMGMILTGCSHDYGSSSPSEEAIENYNKIFIQTFGEPAVNHDWGFGATTANASGATRAMTRATMPEQPTFRDTNPIVRPTMPGYSSSVPANAIYAGTIDWNHWPNDTVVYINAANHTVNGDAYNLTIYVDGNVTFEGYVSQNGRGTTLCVTQNSTLKLQTIQNNLTVYLAPGATLDLSEIEGDATFNGGTILLNAGSTITGDSLTIFNGGRILNAGGTINVSKLSVDKQSTLWNEGTINATDKLTGINEEAFIYNAPNKTITAGNLLLINNDDLLYNNGTVTVADSIALQNTTAEIVNNDTITAVDFSMAAGGKMHNVGTATFTGKTKLTNSNSQWMNDGEYTSGTFDVDNYSVRNYNNCRLTVTDNFFLNRGEFVLNAGAALVTNSFTWEDTSNFWMNSSSLVKVATTLMTHNYNSDYGFRGVGEAYAVIQANAIAIESNEQYRMSYFGNLYVDANTHFSQWYKDDDESKGQPAYYYDPTVKFSFSDPADVTGKVVASAAPVTIPASKCTPGYTGIAETITIPIDQGETTEDRVKIETTIEHYKKTELIEQGRVFCEDLGQISTNDLDFNDVVFDAYVYKETTQTRTIILEDGVLRSDVTVNVDSTYKTTIVLLAAGGTLQLSLAGSEVHNLLGGNPTTTIINTATDSQGAYGNTFYTNDPVVMGTDFSYSSIVEIPIKVFYTSGKTLELKAEQGWAPHKILVPIGTKWCRERVNIANAYKDFLNYVGSSQDFWEGTIDSSLLYSHPKDTYQPRSTQVSVELTSIEGPTTTYRDKGTTSTTGGYQNEEVLSRQTR